MCPESKAQSEGAGSAVPVVSRATQLLIEERQKLAGTRQCGPEGGEGGLGPAGGAPLCVPILAALQQLAGSHL